MNWPVSGSAKSKRHVFQNQELMNQYVNYFFSSLA